MKISSFATFACDFAAAPVHLNKYYFFFFFFLPKWKIGRAAAFLIAQVYYVR